MVKLCSTDDDPVYQDGRLAEADDHALAIFAAEPADLGLLPIVANHRHTAERVGPVADQRDVADRRCDVTVLDQVGLAGRKDEVAVADVHLATFERHAIDPALDRAN